MLASPERQPALLSNAIEGYIRRPHIENPLGQVIATIVELKGSRGYGVMARTYVRAETPDGQLFHGSCSLGCDFLLLRKVKA